MSDALTGGNEVKTEASSDIASYADALWACHEFLPHERLLQRALTSVLHQVSFVLSIANDKLRKNTYSINTRGVINRQGLKYHWKHSRTFVADIIFIIFHVTIIWHVWIKSPRKSLEVSCSVFCLVAH